MKEVAPANLRSNLFENTATDDFSKWITPLGLRLFSDDGAEYLVEYAKSDRADLRVVVRSATRVHCCDVFSKLAEALKNFCTDNYPGLKDKWIVLVLLKSANELARFEFNDCHLKDVQSLAAMNEQGTRYYVSNAGQQFSVREVLGLPEGIKR